MHLAKLVVLAALSLSAAACSGGEPRSVAEALRAMDNSGGYPQLNHDETVAGPDANRNGVRDDLDAYIDSLPDTPAQKAALRQTVAALTRSMTADHQNEASTEEVSRSIANATTCLFERYGPGIASDKSNEMEKFTVNTKNRFRAYAAANAAASGHVIPLPRDSGCLN